MKSDILSVFANPVRLKLLMCLGDGERNVSELIGNCGLSQSAVSQHLEKLKRAKLVSTRREGKEIYYKSNFKESSVLSKKLSDFEKEVLKSESKKR